MAVGAIDPARPDAPKRIVIIGNAGGGKSTLAKRISRVLGIPHHCLDDIQWAPGWIPVAADVLAEAHRAWVAEERWIIEGYGPDGPITERFGRADLILHVDLPFWRHVWWVTKRQLKAHLGLKPVTPNGCDFRGVYWSMIRMMWNLHQERGEISARAFAEIDRGCVVKTLRSARDINGVLNRRDRDPSR